jgi:opacity protein-like surface antigen
MRAIAAFGLAAISLFGAALGAARAADLSPAYPPAPVYAEPDAQFEFGTGWYLRGDASFGPEDQPRLTAAGFDTGHSATGWGVGGGVGYKFNTILRVDVTGDYLDPYKYSLGGVTTLANGDPATYLDKAELQRYDGLVNVYADLGTWYGLTPYVGAGVGFGVFNPTDTVAYTDTTTQAQTKVNRRPSSVTNLAWAAMSGVSYQIDPNIGVDLGYRHLDLGHFSTTLVGYTVDHRFTTDEVRLGVRYMLN